MTGFFIALISGALMSLQGVFNTEVTKQSSMWVSASWVQFSALVTCLVVWAVSDRSSFGALLKVNPRYVMLGGIFGAFITYGDPEHVGAGARKGDDAHRHRSAHRVLAGGAYGTVRGG